MTTGRRRNHVWAIALGAVMAAIGTAVLGTRFPTDERVHASVATAREKPTDLVKAALIGLWRHARTTALTHQRLFSFSLLGGLFALALWSRYRYVIGDDTYTLGTGDAHLILVKALLISRGVLSPPPELVPVTEVFDQPPLIPLVFAGIHRLTAMPLEIAPFVIVPLVTSVAMLAFFGFVRRAFDLPTAIIATVLLALLPHFSFDSTEPEKAPFVVSFVMVALWFLMKSQERRALLLLAGLFLGLAAFAHATGYLFIPVFILSYFALYGVSRRSVFDPLFLGALAITALSIGAYWGLSQISASTGEQTGGSSGTILPAFVQTYGATLWDLASHGFTGSAWERYFQGIRQQLTTPVCLMAVIGFVVATGVAVGSRRRSMAPVLLWASLVTIGFAIQYPAASHGSRYPSYVAPAFVALAAYLCVTAGRLAAVYLRPRWLGRPAAVALAMAVIGVLGLQYATTPNPGLRYLYASHRDLANFIAQEGILDDGSHMLFLGWPSITLFLLEHDLRYIDSLHTFGWGSRDLHEFTPEFIRTNNIRFYAYDRTGTDYYDSARIMLEQLARDYRLVQLKRFQGPRGHAVELFRLDDCSRGCNAEVAAFLETPASDLEHANILRNPQLEWSSVAGVPWSWNMNGWVTLEPATADGTQTGILVRSKREFGGVRQVVNVEGLAGKTVTAIAVVRAVGSQPAPSVVLALAAEGERPFAQIFEPLRAEKEVVVLESAFPEDVSVLRLTLATGLGGAGDFAIDRVLLIPMPLDDIVQLASKITLADGATEVLSAGTVRSSR